MMLTADMEDNKKINVSDLWKLICQIRETCIDYISSCVKDADEEHPFECNIMIGQDSAYAISSLEMPHIAGMFVDNGNIYVNIDGSTLDLDFIEVVDLLTIVESLQGD